MVDFEEIKDRIREFYYKLEDKFYAFVDFLDSKGIPAYRIVEALESRNIPSFPVFIAMCLILVILLVLLFTGFFGGIGTPPNVSLTVKVTDESGVAVQGARVVVSWEDKTVSKSTNAEGKATFQIPAGVNFKVDVTKKGYMDASSQFRGITKDETKTIKLKKEQPKTIKKVIKFYKENTQELVTEELNIYITCSDNPDFEMEAIVNDGMVEAEVPEDCGSINVEVTGTNFSGGGAVLINDPSPIIFLEGAEETTGTIVVTVTNVQGEPLARITIAAYNVPEGKTIDDVVPSIAQTSESGQVELTDMLPGTYYIVASDDLFSKYKETMIGPFELAPDETVRKTITMEEAIVGTIRIKVVDVTTNQPIPGALVELMRNNVVQKNALTEADGSVAINVAEDLSYNVRVSAQGYYKAVIRDVRVSPTLYEISLQRKQGEGGAIVVKVLDEKTNKPLQNIKVTLRDRATRVPLETKATGADGIAKFFGLKPGTYYATAEKAGVMISATRDIDLSENEMEIVEIRLTIPKGTIVVRVKGEFDEPVKDATVIAYDLVTKKRIGEERTTADGIAQFSIPLDTTPYFVVKKEGLLPTITLPAKPTKGIDVNVDVSMYPEPASVEVKFLGLKAKGQDVMDTLQPGQRYEALFVLLVPSDRPYEMFGIHVRTGNEEEGETVTVEEDPLYIRNVTASTPRIKRGASYTPPLGSPEDTKRGPKGMAKWVSVEWVPDGNSIPTSGAFILSVTIQTKTFDSEDEQLWLRYRGYAVAEEAYYRDPKDAELGMLESTADKGALYANTKQKLFRPGATMVCNAGYCVSFTLEDDKGSTVALNEKADVELFKNYKLSFKILKISGGTLREPMLKVSNSTAGLKLKRYELIDALTKKLEGSAVNNEITVEMSNFPKDTTISGMLEFSTEKEGSNDLTVSVISKGKTRFSTALTINVLPGREMRIDVLPAFIMPGIDNELLIRTVDAETEEPLQSTLVSVYVNDALVSQGTTDSNGVLPYVLATPAPGDNIKLVATRPSYKHAERTIEVQQELLSFFPPKLEFDLKANVGEENQFDFNIENLTPVPVVITNIVASKEFGNLVEFEGEESYVGTQIEGAQQQKITLIARLTKAGRDLEEPKTLEGSITVSVKNEEFDRQWNASIPLRIRILLGGEVDSANCLVVKPVTWEISTSSAVQTLNVELENTCTVEGTPIALKKLSARIDAPTSIGAGTITLRPREMKGASTLELTTQNKVFAEEVGPNLKGKLELSFIPNPNVDSVESSFTIVFEASHPTDAGKETLEATIDVKATVNRLTRCVKVSPKELVLVTTMPYNTGFDAYSGYFNRNPLSQPYVNPYTGYGTTQPWGYDTSTTTPYGAVPGARWPYSLYGTREAGINTPTQGFTTNYGINAGQQWPSYWGTATESFKVENACKMAVEITLDVPPSLSVDEESFVLEPYEKKKLNVGAGIKVGAFEITVKGKLANSQEPFIDINTVKVKVQRLEDVEYKCRPILEPTYFRVPFIGYSQTNGKVYNKCYDLGYRLMRMSAENFKCFTPESQGTSLSTGMCPLIAGVFVKEPRVENTAQGLTEIMEFTIFYNPNITTQYPQLGGENLPEAIGKIRIILGKLFNAIRSPGIVEVPYTNTWGIMKVATYDVVFENPYEWLGLLTIKMKKGSERLQPAECIKDPEGVLDIASKKGWLSDKDFVNDKYVFNENPPAHEMVMPMPRNDAEAKSGEFCGYDDYIEDIGIKRYKDKRSGVEITFQKAKNGHHIVVTVDRSKMVTECASIEFYNPVKVRRVHYNPRIQQVDLKVAVNVLNKGVKEYTPGCEENVIAPQAPRTGVELKKCENTGNETYTRYGFDKLIYDWSPEEFTATSCDAADSNSQKEKFCDATQFALSLMARYNSMKKALERLNEAYEQDSSLSAIREHIASNGKLEDELVGGDIYIISKRQFVTHDMTNQGTTVQLFFLGNSATEPTLVAPATQKSASCDYQYLKDLVTTSINSALPQNFDELLNDKLKECYGSDITTSNILYIMPSKDGSTIATEMLNDSETTSLWQNLTEQNIIEYIDALNAYVLSFNELDTIRKQLSTYADMPGDVLVIIVLGNAEFSASKAAWLKLIQAMNKYGKFRIGLMNVPGLADAHKEAIRKNAVDILDGSDAELLSGKVGRALLLYDKYDEGFKYDFAFIYKKTYAELTKRTFTFKFYQKYEGGSYEGLKKDNVAEPGQYVYRVIPKVKLADNGNLTMQGMEVRLAQEKTLEEIDVNYAKNILFYLPLDAPLSTKAKRDYGVALQGKLPAEVLVSVRGNIQYPLPERRTGLVTLRAVFKQTMDSTKLGRVLRIDLANKKIEFSPSVPAGLKLTWQDESSKNAVFYRFADGKIYGKADGLFTWWLNRDEQEASDELKEFAPPQGPFCTNFNEKRKLARVVLPTAGDWFAMTFVPLNADATLELFCAQRDVVIKVRRFDDTEAGTVATRGLAGGSVRLQPETHLTQSIQEYLEEIANGRMCVKLTRQTLELAWNPGMENQLPE